MAIRRACEGTGELELRGATLYSILQPCGMCTMASIWSKVGRVVYGAGRDDVHPMYFEARHVDTLSSSPTPPRRHHDRGRLPAR
ncbi:deaminase [Sphingomonas sp. MMS24-JH45]